MIFNRWRKYPKKKPKEYGDYLCTMIYDDPENIQIHVLTWSPYHDGEWIFSNRQSVFDGYKVYKPCREPIEENRVHWDSLSKPGHLVLAWKKLPKEYRVKGWPVRK